MIIWLLLFNLLIWHIILIDLWILKKSLHPWEKAHLIMVYDHFNVLLESVNILLRVFAYYTGLWFSFLCIISFSGFGIKIMVVL